MGILDAFNKWYRRLANRLAFWRKRDINREIWGKRK